MISSSNINMYVKLITDSDLSVDDVRKYYNVVKNNIPSGLTTTIQIPNDKGDIVNIPLIKFKEKNKFYYIIPLIRNLNENEGQKVVDFLDFDFDFDFDFEISSNTPQSRLEKIEVSQDRYKDLCDNWAKKRHEDWMKERQAQGWSYGVNISIENKTHPLLKPWHELPEKFKQTNTDEPETFLKMINDSGYVLLSKDEIEAISKIFK